MRLLLDTHVILWLLSETRRLGARTRIAMRAAEEVAFSVVSFVEIGVKASIGQLAVPDDVDSLIIGMGVRILGLSPSHGLAVGRLPLHHRDPFDRLLVVQAQMEGLTLVTADRHMSAYEVALLDPLS